MMVTVSHIVGKIIEDKPLLQEAISEGIISYAALAEKIKEEVENELKRKVQHSAIVMAVRRHSESIQLNKKRNFRIKSDITLRGGLVDCTVQKNQSMFEKLEKIQKSIDYSKGDTLNILHGNYETSIIFNERHKERIADAIRGMPVRHTEENLVSLSITVSEKFMDTPGVIANIARKLQWENINIYEMIAILTEVVIIVKKEDAMKCYEVLEKMMNSKN